MENTPDYSLSKTPRLEQNIGIIACCVPTLQPLFKFLNKRITRDSHSKGGIRNSLALPRWNNSASNKFGSRSRTFHNIQNVDTHSDSEDQILADEGKAIRKTTDVELFYHEAPANEQAKDISKA